ncbi:CHRD domain-containing protein [Nesterenkonia pannonica]|uniref:CHRD domain-containing protein n=1 Tax=Nesterenkonia pannonica TaxID=1548602 RepID=UPI0021648F45|nr:CHRD domain-containing protein [Nesterenkonia pannonica]
MTRSTIRRTGFIGAGIAVTGGASLLLAAPAQAMNEAEWPEEFTSAYSVMAVPEEVINDEGEQETGEEGATGEFMLWMNSDTDTICYEITLNGVSGEYESPAISATHIHEASLGEFGPPRVAFADPEPVGDGVRESSGCIEGPFVTGVDDDEGNDHGEGFTVAQIEEDPSAFQADTHTDDYPAGTVRGQLMQVPLDGVETGGGGAEQSAVAPMLGVGAAAAALGLGALAFMRRRAEQA